MLETLRESLPKKTHIIWDWNGTLLNDVTHAVQTMNSLLKDHELEALTEGRYREIFDFPVLNYYQALGFNFAKETFESLCHRFVDLFMEGFVRCPLVSGMREVVLNFHQEGIQQSVLSASDQKSLEQMISHFELNPYFSHVMGINNKLAASKLERGQELLANSPFSNDKTVLVGDTLHDLEIGQALGIDVLLLAHGHQSVERLRARHDRVWSPPPNL